MSIETIGWITGVLLIVLGGAGGWTLRGAHEKRAAGMVVGPPPHVPPVRPPLSEHEQRRFPQPAPRPAPRAPAPPQQPPQVARTPARPPSAPPARPPLRMPNPGPRHRLQPQQAKPRPNAHEDNTRSRVSPVGRRWQPNTTHTEALPVVQPAEEGT